MTNGPERVVLRNARLSNGRTVDVHIDDGFITEVTSVGVDVTAPVAAIGDRDTSEDFGQGDTAVGAGVDATEHDLGGWLLLASMAEPHAHLDKALTAEAVPNPTGDLIGAIEAWSAAAEAGTFSHEDTVERASTAMGLLLVHGITAVRTHVNVLASTGAANVVAVREAAERFRGLLDVEIVALTGIPVTGPDGAPTRKALAAALEAGVDLIGGCPHLDPDGPELISMALAAASEAGIGVDLHVDEQLDPSVLTLRDLAGQVMDTGFEHLVTASHCVTLGMQTPELQAQIAAEVAEAGVSIVTLPQTNLFLQGRDVPTATPRGLTAVQALVDAGAVVAAGADNVQDPFNLVGRSDPLETAALMVMAAHQLPDHAYDMVSNLSRVAMGLAPVRFLPGDPADLVAIDAPSIRGAIADAPMARRVFRRGKLVASCDQQLAIHRPS